MRWFGSATSFRAFGRAGSRERGLKLVLPCASDRKFLSVGLAWLVLRRDLHALFPRRFATAAQPSAFLAVLLSAQTALPRCRFHLWPWRRLRRLGPAGPSRSRPRLEPGYP